MDLLEKNHISYNCKNIDDLFFSNRVVVDLLDLIRFAAGGKTLLQIFPAKAQGLGQRAVYNELQAIKDFRNRIAHHEAICFDDSGAKNTQPAKDSYSLVLKYVQFFGYPESHLYSGLDVLPDKILRKIDTL